jgi:very-short-patch-repair endonuclease
MSLRTKELEEKTKTTRISSPEEFLFWQIRVKELPLPYREYRFDPIRKFRFDFAWPDFKIAVEVEGGLWIYGRHQRPVTFQRDLDKYNLALLHGWRVFRFSPEMIEDGYAISVLEKVLQEALTETKASKPRKPK